MLSSSSTGRLLDKHPIGLAVHPTNDLSQSFQHAASRGVNASDGSSELIGHRVCRLLFDGGHPKTSPNRIIKLRSYLVGGFTKDFPSVVPFKRASALVLNSDILEPELTGLAADGSEVSRPTQCIDDRVACDRLEPGAETGPLGVRLMAPTRGAKRISASMSVNWAAEISASGCR